MRKEKYHIEASDADEEASETPLVTHEVVQALEATTPYARYYVTRLIWALAFLVRVIPSKAMDAFLSKASNGVPVFASLAAKGAVLHPPDPPVQVGGGGAPASEEAAKER